MTTYVAVVYETISGTCGRNTSQYRIKCFRRGFTSRVDATAWAIRQSQRVGVLSQDRWSKWIEQYGGLYGYRQDLEIEGE